MKENEIFRILLSIIYRFQYNFFEKKNEFFLFDIKNIRTNVYN